MARKKLNNLTAEELQKLASDLTDEELKWANEELFTPYIFFRTHGQERECFCTSCRKHFDAGIKRTMTQKDYSVIENKHNEKCICPECGRTCTLKNIGRSKDACNLTEWQRAVYVQVLNKNAVLLKCYYIHKSYNKKNYITEAGRFLKSPNAQLSCVYLLQPGNVQKARLDGWNNYYFPLSWHLKSTTREPFVAMMGNDTSYSTYGIKKLSKTFLKYSPYEEIIQEFYFFPLVTFLCRSAELPALEVLTKLGYIYIVKSLLFGDKYNKRLINWSATKIHEIFKLSKADYNVLRDSKFKGYAVIEVLKTYQIFSRYKIGGMTAAVHWVNDLLVDTYYINKIKKHFDVVHNLTHLENYINKQKEIPRKGSYCHSNFGQTLSYYCDYLNMAKYCNYDLKNQVVVFPKKLEKAHDTATENYNLIKQAEQAAAIKEKAKGYKKITKKNKDKYEYVGKKYSIVVPEGPDDIIHEGSVMHHCVGGYAERHFTGKLTILFLRKNTALGESYYTIEMNDKKLQQIQGYGNKHPISEDKEAEAFFNEWLEWVENGSQRPKENKQKTA